jgi:hypothetical protein
MSDTSAPASDAPAPTRRRRTPDTSAPVSTSLVRFSGPYLIGDTGLTPPAGTFVRVAGSQWNDGLYEVLNSDDEWLIVKPFVRDEAPSQATVTVEAVA